MKPVNTNLSLGSSDTIPQPKSWPLVARNRRKIFKPVRSPFVSTPALNKSSKNKSQPGYLLEFAEPSDLARVLSKAHLEAFFNFPSKRVLSNLVTEFYANLVANPGINSSIYLSSVVSGTPVLINQDTLSKALDLHPSLLLVIQI